MVLNENHLATPFMKNQYWFMQWLIVVRQQAITWANSDPDLCHQRVSLIRTLRPRQNHHQGADSILKWISFLWKCFPDTYVSPGLNAVIINKINHSEHLSIRYQKLSLSYLSCNYIAIWHFCYNLIHLPMNSFIFWVMQQTKDHSMYSVIEVRMWMVDNCK